MIVALMMGRAGSQGFPNKNLKKILGKHLCEYPLISATRSNLVDKIYVTTDCPKIKKIALKYNANIIDRPKHLCTSEALGEDVYEHAYLEIKKKHKKKIKMFVLLMANAPTVNYKLINKGINILKKNKKYDSAVSTSVYNMWSPLRARKLDRNNCLVPFIPFKYFGNPKILNCDRDSQGNVYFADMSVSVVRSECLENLKNGLLPQKWMGKKIASIPSEGGCDIDYEWQLPSVKFWIKKYFK